MPCHDTAVAIAFAFQTPAPDFALAVLKGLSHVAPHAHVLRLDDRAGSADKTLKLYDGHFHDLLNDLGKDTVMTDITSWIEARSHAT